MAKGEMTRQRIVARAADVFNTRGFFGTSMGDLTRATGLEKGGIYNHFASKEALALAAFDHAVELISDRISAAMADKVGFVARMEAMIGAFREIVERPPLQGGCPVLNTAVEADDTSPTMRERAQQTMTSWMRLIGKTVKEGVAAGELPAGADPYQIATVVTATLEGAIMLSKLYGDPAYIRRAADHAIDYVRALTR